MNVYDGMGRMTCTADPESGEVEWRYRDRRVTLIMAPGETCSFIRDAQKTVLTRLDNGGWHIDRSTVEPNRL